MNFAGLESAKPFVMAGKTLLAFNSESANPFAMTGLTLIALNLVSANLSEWQASPFSFQLVLCPSALENKLFEIVRLVNYLAESINLAI